MTLDANVQSALKWLKSHSTKANRDGMARYAIPSEHAYGVAMKDIKALGKTLGKDQALAAALWDTGVYEARMLASFVGDPTQLTSAQMDRWCKSFDNWAFCDALSFNFRCTPCVGKGQSWIGHAASSERMPLRCCEPTVPKDPTTPIFEGLG